MIASDWPILIPLVVGHLALFVLALNLLHSTAVPERVLDILNLTLLGATLLALPIMLTQGHWSTWPQPARGLRPGLPGDLDGRVADRDHPPSVPPASG